MTSLSMAGNVESSGSSMPQHTMDNVTEYCFLFNCSNKEKSLPREFLALFVLHKKSSMAIIQGQKTWEIEIDDRNFGLGWELFVADNLIKPQGRILIQHIGDLRFELILFTEAQMNTMLPWTVPLSNVLHQHLPVNNDIKPKYISYQHVCTSIKPDIVQDLIDSIAFYQVYTSKYTNKLKLPRYVDHFLNEVNAPNVTLRTGYRPFQIYLQGGCFTTYWETFVETHQLEIGETLVFIPESVSIFTVQIFRTNGVEKVFPWYHKYYVYSYL